MNSTSLGLPDIYRSQHVKRWHIVHTARQQTVAEHSYMVAMISMYLIDAMDQTANESALFLRSDKLDILKWALMHDLPEVIMGDAVSPVKRLAKGAFDRVEEQVDPDLKSYERGLPGHIKAIVKTADYIDALKYLQTEGINGQSKSIYKRLHGDMKHHLQKCKERWPNFNWFVAIDVLTYFLYGNETYIDNII